MSWKLDSYFLKVVVGGIMPNRHGSHEEMGQEDGFEVEGWEGGEFGGCEGWGNGWIENIWV